MVSHTTDTEFSVTNLFYLHLSDKFFIMLFNRTGDYFGTFNISGEIFCYICHGFVSAGDALGRERLATPMSSFLAGHSGCK